LPACEPERTLRSITECPLQNSEAVKAMDAAWLSNQRCVSKSNDPVYLIAPEICIQVASPANSMEEMMERKRLYFEKGAEELWLCNLNGKVAFYDEAAVIPQSKLCPGFSNILGLGDGKNKGIVGIFLFVPVGTNEVNSFLGVSQSAIDRDKN
jgi:hypothetical protein